VYVRTDDVNVGLLLAHFLYLMEWIEKSVTNIITKEYRSDWKKESSSYPTLHNPPES